MRVSIIVDEKPVELVLNSKLELLRDRTGVHQAMATEGESLARQSFRQQRDPHGRPWKRLRSRRGQALRKSGRLQRSVKGRGRKTVATVGTRVAYARRHNEGFFGREYVPSHTRTVRQAFGRPIAARPVTVRSHVRQANTPQRKFLPTRRVPKTWERRITDVVREYLA